MDSPSVLSSSQNSNIQINVSGIQGKESLTVPSGGRKAELSLDLHTEEDFVAALGAMDSLLCLTDKKKKDTEEEVTFKGKSKRKPDGPSKENAKPRKSMSAKVEVQNLRSQKLTDWKKQKEEKSYKHVHIKLESRRSEPGGSKTDMREKLAEWRKIKNEEKARQAEEKKKLKPAFGLGTGPKASEVKADRLEKSATATKTQVLKKTRRNTLGPAIIGAQKKMDISAVNRRKSVAVGMSAGAKPSSHGAKESTSHKVRQHQRHSIAAPTRKSFSTIHRTKTATSTGPGTGKSRGVPSVTVSKPEGEKPGQQPQVAQKRKSMASQEKSQVVKKRPRKSILKMVVHSDDEDITEEVVEPTASSDKAEIKCQHVKFLSPAAGFSNKCFIKTPARTPPITKEMSMREKLDIWLREKNQTPSRFHHLRCFGHDMLARKAGQAVPASKGGLTSTELNRQQEKIALEEVTENLNSKFDDESDEAQMAAPAPPDNLADLLQECLLLNDVGCPAANIMQWLDEMLSTIPSASRNAEYWAARCTVVQGHQGALAGLGVVEEGIRREAKPADKLAGALRTCVEQLKLANVSATCEQNRPAKSLFFKRVTLFFGGFGKITLNTLFLLFFYSFFLDHSFFTLLSGNLDQNAH